MYRKKPDVDIIRDLLEMTLAANPGSAFIKSLLLQYEERGGLSKKQLEGLYKKAERLKPLPTAKLATLEAVILKRPTRFKSELPGNEPLYTRDERIGLLIGEILGKYPGHKRVLFFQAKYDNNELLSTTEIAELERFHKLLNK